MVTCRSRHCVSCQRKLRSLTVYILHVNFCRLSQQRIMHHAFTDMFLKTANGNTQVPYWRRRVWQASLPWPKQPEFYTQRACLQTPQGTSTRNAYRCKFFRSFFGTWRTTEAHHDTVSVTSHPARHPQGTSVQCLSSGHVWSFAIRAFSSLCTISGQMGRPSLTTPGAPVTVPGKPECPAAYSFRRTYQPLTL